MELGEDEVERYFRDGRAGSLKIAVDGMERRMG